MHRLDENGVLSLSDDSPVQVSRLVRAFGNGQSVRLITEKRIRVYSLSVTTDTDATFTLEYSLDEGDDPELFPLDQACFAVFLDAVIQYEWSLPYLRVT